MKDVNKRLCELLGCEPYETYSRLTGLYIEDYPDFADPSGRIDLLKRMILQPMPMRELREAEKMERDTQSVLQPMPMRELRGVTSATHIPRGSQFHFSRTSSREFSIVEQNPFWRSQFAENITSRTSGRSCGYYRFAQKMGCTPNSE